MFYLGNNEILYEQVPYNQQDETLIVKFSENLHIVYFYWAKHTHCCTGSDQNGKHLMTNFVSNETTTFPKD